MSLKLTRPLVVFDIESTGIKVAVDRIIEISLIKLFPDETQDQRTYLINPTIPIPEEATMIHGISDDDIKDKPTFGDIGHELLNYLNNCDLAGYNSNKFDIPLLIEEFLRIDISFDTKNRFLVDVQNIFHKMEPRTLKAAYKYYCGKELINAHSASADTLATYEVLLSQIERYKDVEYTDKEGNTTVPIKNDVKSLHNFSFKSEFVDLVGHIVYNNKKEEVFNFGKHKGKAVEKVFRQEPQYYDWMMKADFPLSTKNIITAIKLRGFNNGSTLF